MLFDVIVHMIIYMIIEVKSFGLNELRSVI